MVVVGTLTSRGVGRPSLPTWLGLSPSLPFSPLLVLQGFRQPEAVHFDSPGPEPYGVHQADALPVDVAAPGLPPWQTTPASSRDALRPGYRDRLIIRLERISR